MRCGSGGSGPVGRQRKAGSSKQRRWSGEDVDGPPVERRLHVIVNDNIKAVMRQKRLSVHDVAEGSGMSRTTLQWRLNRPSTWQLDELPAVAKALGVPVASLFEARP
jgi:lambda repressor-like predicted transcriptional regulator